MLPNILAEARSDLAAAFRWTARLNLHEAVANHFSLAIDDSGRRFLINPNGRHFARISARDLIEIDADDPAAMFHDRVAIDDGYGGMALGDEGARCAALLADAKVKTMIMGNHGILVIGETVAETFNRLYYFERAAETYTRALQTGRPLRVLPDAVAEKTAREWESYPSFAQNHLRELKAILREEGVDFDG